MMNSREKIYQGPFCERAFEDLIDSKIVAMVVPDFTHPDVIAAMAKAYADVALEDYSYLDQKLNTYVTVGVKRAGVPFNSTYQNDAEALSQYYAQVPHAMQTLRAKLAPLMSPIDQLRLMIDEVWAPGANLACFGGHKNFVGMYRYTESAISVLGEKPHFDSLPTQKAPLSLQLAANIYMHTPSQGGELLLWDTPPLPHEQVGPYQESEAFQELVASPPISIKPQPGMLIMFHTRKPHAVAGFSEGKRSSMQCFIGMQPDRRIVLWN